MICSQRDRTSEHKHHDRVAQKCSRIAFFERGLFQVVLFRELCLLRTWERRQELQMNQTQHTWRRKIMLQLVSLEKEAGEESGVLRRNRFHSFY